MEISARVPSRDRSAPKYVGYNFGYLSMYNCKADLVPDSPLHDDYLRINLPLPIQVLIRDIIGQFIEHLTTEM